MYHRLIDGLSGAVTPTYDVNGNLTRDETGRQFVYDAWNRSVEVRDSSGNLLKSYAYDGLHRRVQETAGGTTTDLYYSDSWQVLEERVGGQTRVQYVWSSVYVDALVLRDRDSNGDGALDERLYVVQDANYNVTALFDNSGNVVERYVYDPFGQATVLDANWNVLAGSAFAWVYLHQGGRFDATSGLYHFRHRDYSPTLGRWTSLDPIRYTAGDVNLYRALGNKPLNSTDPFGLYEWPWSPNARWQLEGSLLGDIIDGACEPIRIGGDLIRVGTQLGSLGTHALGWTDIYEYQPHSWLMQGWFRAVDEGRAGEYLWDLELAVLTLGIKPLGEAIYEGDWRNVSRMAGGYLTAGGTTALFRPRPGGLTRNPVTEVGAGIRNWLGEGARVVRNDARGFVILSRDGLRRFRIDFQGHSHHPRPHAHLEILNREINEWVDAIPGRHFFDFQP